jgi:hypothetical protein
VPGSRFSITGRCESSNRLRSLNSPRSPKRCARTHPPAADRTRCSHFGKAAERRRRRRSLRARLSRAGQRARQTRDARIDDARSARSVPEQARDAAARLAAGKAPVLAENPRLPFRLNLRRKFRGKLSLDRHEACSSRAACLRSSRGKPLLILVVSLAKRARAQSAIRRAVTLETAAACKPGSPSHRPPAARSSRRTIDPHP